MITNPQTVRSKREFESAPHHLRHRWAVFRHVSLTLVALVLAVGGQMAHADQGAPPIAPTAAAGNSSAKPTQAFSARALVAQADADLAAGRPGLAIVGYERARLLAPRASSVTAGLARARSIAGLPSTKASLANRAMTRLDPNEWSWVALAGLILTGAGAVAVAWGLSRRRGFVTMALAGAAVAGLGALGAVEVTPGRDSAVVVAADTVARIAPFSKADEAFAVPEGSLVTVERTYDHYVLIAGADGRGWVPERGVELILPGTGKRS